MDDLLRGFEDVDRGADRQSFFEFLDLAARLPSIAKYRERMLELCPTGHGSAVLDVGCGLGGETARIALRVGKTGMVCGVDTSEDDNRSPKPDPGIGCISAIPGLRCAQPYLQRCVIRRVPGRASLPLSGKSGNGDCRNGQGYAIRWPRHNLRFRLGRLVY